VPKLTFCALAALAFLVLAPSLGLAQSSAASAPIEYKAGQVWRVADGDELITILKVEDLPKLGHVIHLRVSNIPVPLCPGMHLTRNIDHIAMNEKMMRKSAGKLVLENTEVADSYFDGYRLWLAEKKPKVEKNETVMDVIRKTSTGLPVICNFVPAETT